MPSEGAGAVRYLLTAAQYSNEHALPLTAPARHVRQAALEASVPASPVVREEAACPPGLRATYVPHVASAGSYLRVLTVKDRART